MGILEQYDALNATLWSVSDLDSDEKQIWLMADSLLDGAEYTQTVVEEGNRILNAQPFPWQEIAEALNVRSESDQESRQLLLKVLNTITLVKEEDRARFHSEFEHLWLQGASRYRLVGPRGVFSDKRDIRIIDRQTDREITVSPDYMHLAAVRLMMVHGVLVEQIE